MGNSFSYDSESRIMTGVSHELLTFSSQPPYFLPLGACAENVNSLPSGLGKQLEKSKCHLCVDVKVLPMS